MTFLVMLLAIIGAAAHAADTDRLPPERTPPPSVRDLPAARPPPAIFTYTVDDECRVTGTRKLQGPDEVSWEVAEREREVFEETFEWRFVDGVRRQLRERRVKLLGEMVREGELVCHVLPSGEVVAAWIERHAAGVARRQAPTREAVAVRDGDIENLGTFSLDIAFDPAAP